MDNLYKGFYARVDSEDKAKGSIMMGPDHIVGDDYEVFFKTEDHRVVAWVRNKFGAETGFFDADATRKLQLANAREQKIRAVLSYVAYSDSPEPGVYWAQMAVFCYSPAYAVEIDAFIDRVAAKLADGTRPAIDLGSQSVGKMIEDPTWFPSKTMPMLEKKKGMAVLKDRESLSEKMIEQARARNKGCYAASIAFIILVVIALLYGLHLLGLF